MQCRAISLLSPACARTARQSGDGIIGKIFLSYASDDRNLAKDIQARLRQHGHDVFFDEDALKPSDGYDKMIRHRIAKSDVMVFLCSRSSLAEGRYTLTELEMAERLWPNPEGRVLPVLVGDVTFDDLPSYLKGLSAYRYKGDPVSEVTHLAEEMVFTRRRKRRLSLGFVFAAIAVLVIAGLLTVNQLRGGQDGETVENVTSGEEEIADAPPAGSGMDESLPIFTVTAPMRTARRDFASFETDGGLVRSVCPKGRFNVYNASDRPLPLRVAVAFSDVSEDVGVIEPGGHMELQGSEEIIGLFLVDLNTESALEYIAMNEDFC